MEDGKKDALIVLPLPDTVKSKDIECKVTRRSVLLTVNGRRLIDGATWGALNADESFWEIDEYKKLPRCLLLRLRKDSPAEWPFLLRSDYELPTDFAGRTVISRPEVEPADVEAALQVLVRLMRPEDGQQQQQQRQPNTEGEDKESGAEKRWKESVEEAREEAWRDAAQDVQAALRQGDGEEVTEILEATRNAVQGGGGGSAAPIACVAFVRHSAAEAPADASFHADRARVLTPQGQNAAHAAKKWFGTLCRGEGAPHGLALSSQAGRCLETAFLLAAPSPIVLEGVYEGMGEEEAWAAYQAEGEQAVAHYITQGHGAVLRQYAERVLVELADAVQLRLRQLRKEQGESAALHLGSVVVFGHGVFGAATALLLAQALRLPRPDTTLLAQALQGEADGLIVSASGTGHVTLDSTTLPEEVDMQTAKTLSAVYATLKKTGMIQT